MPDSTRRFFQGEPAKIILAPPGLRPLPCLASELSRSGLQAPPGLNTGAEGCQYAVAGMDAGYHMSLHGFEAQKQGLANDWELAEYDFWDNLYETCTQAALWPHTKATTQTACATARSEVSEETVSTVDTLPVFEDDGSQEIALLTKALQGGPAEQEYAFDCIIEQMQSLCKTQQGSLLAQSALVLATGSRLDALLVKLSGFVFEACKSPHGNHVIQKCIDVFGHGKSQFIVDGLAGKAVPAARDRFGCRIMEHLVDNCPQEQISGLLDELLMDAKRLCRHPFGNYVMQSVVKCGTRARRAEVAELLIADAVPLARHRFATHVFQLAIAHCEPADGTRLVQASKRPAKMVK